MEPKPLRLAFFIQHDESFLLPPGLAHGKWIQLLESEA